MSDRPRVSGLAAQARAVRAHKERVVVASRTYGAKQTTIRVVIDGKCYDVGPRDLAWLQSGKVTPEDLELSPVEV